HHSQGDTATLLCLSTNALGTSSLQLHAPSTQRHSDFSIPSLLIGAAAGAGAIMCICLIMQLVLTKKRHSQGSRMKDTEGLILMAGATYGNICRSRPTKRAQQGQQETPRNPAPEEEEQREEGQEDMYVDLMSPLTEGGGKGVEESEYAEVRKLQ
ncbi:hypothetical protein COCON_G00002290, partial [Conger conger]